MEEKKTIYIDVHLNKEKDPDSKYFEILNGAAKLTQKERSVFLTFCKQYRSNPTPDILVPYVRREVSTIMRMSSSGLNNIIIELKKKNAILLDNNGCYYLNPILIPNDTVEEVVYRIYR